MGRPRICLNMIVKDEAMVIRRCLDAAKPFIDCWAIVDTGSTDGTQQIIRENLRGLDGTLLERAWRDFGHNRNEALQLARDRADYLLFIDADETLYAPPDFAWPALGGDAYYLLTEYAGTTYSRCALVATRLDWRWVGVLHEFLQSTPAATIRHLDWPRIQVSHDGARARDPKTYENDVAILERVLADEPDNARNAFYLAQSYRDAGNLDRAREAYRRRASMGGFAEEIWFSLYQIGVLRERLGHSPGDVSRAYLEAWEYRPTRGEPLSQLARYHRERKEFALGYLYARQACAIPMPPDLLFVDVSMYQWRALDELAACAYYVGAFDEGRTASERLLGEGLLPAQQRLRVEENLRFYLNITK
jgi:glycosyltransferase involved in cell wall biosynthesis